MSSHRGEARLVSIRDHDLCQLVSAGDLYQSLVDCDMNLFPLFKLLEVSFIGASIRESSWLFPAIDATHLLALAMLGGAVLIVDLRLLNLMMQQRDVRELAVEAQPWQVGSLVIMIITGVLLFLSEAVKCYYSWPFRIKIVCLISVILFSFTV